MKTWLRRLAWLCLAATLGIWGFAGANAGWTKTSVQVQKVDPVLEMEYVEWEKVFLPGIDFIAGGLLLTGLLWGTSFIIARPKRS